VANDKGKGMETKPPSEAKDTAKAKEATNKAKETEAKTKEIDSKAKTPLPLSRARKKTLFLRRPRLSN